MKIIKTALLLSGLFFSGFLFAQTPAYDSTDFRLARQLPDQHCYTVRTKQVCGNSQQDAFPKAISAYQVFVNAENSCGSEDCTTQITTVSTEFPVWVFRIIHTYFNAAGGVVYRNDNQYQWSPAGYQLLPGGVYVCPPIELVDPNNPADVLANTYNIGPITVGSEKHCYRPLPPLDCDALQGFQPSALNDSFITGDSYTTENPPSCITKCADDASGNRRCGDCKVVAKSWGRQSVGNGQMKWWANAGTFTGAACGAEESEVPPPDAPKCWETKNGLTMCIQDPAEKCVTVNGVQQCESGCGYVNSEFYCQDKTAEPKPDPNDKDKPLPPTDDAITNPEKPLQDMLKGDFKDVQRGVESRVGQVVTGIGNLENSVDALDNSLESIGDKLDESNSLAQAGNSLLKGIKEGLSEDGGECVPSPQDDCSGDPEGDCDPLTDKNCANETGAPSSWWNSQYPEGMTSLLNDKKSSFQNSNVYTMLSQDLTISSGAAPDWQLCFDVLSSSFGCHSIVIPPYIWTFIKACMLFGAAILSRRMLIGA